MRTLSLLFLLAAAASCSVAATLDLLEDTSAPTAPTRCLLDGCDCSYESGATKLSITCDGVLDYYDGSARPPPPPAGLGVGRSPYHHNGKPYYEASTRFPARENASRISAAASSSTGVEIESLVVQNYNLKQHVPDDAFADLALGSLRLTENELERITVNCLRGVRALNKLVISDRSFRIIEEGAFEHVRELLSELDIVSTDLIDERLDAWHGELGRLGLLQVLVLDNNHLTRVSDTWFVNMSNLLKLSLSSNAIERLEPNAFKDMRSLRRLNMQHNKLADTFDQTPLLAFRSSLVYLNLSSNMIRALPVFDAFESLSYLDLSHNLIHTISPKTFRNLARLYVLDLSHNDIRVIYYDTFASQAGLYYLKLHNNALESVPSIRRLSSLINLDLRQQQGKLLQLKDYQFERENQTLLPLTVDLDENEIRNVDSKPFCSRTASNETHTDTLVLTSRTFMRIISKSVCILSQLGAGGGAGRSKVDIYVRRSAQSAGPSMSVNANLTLCNCEFIAFLRRFGLNVEANFELDCPRGIITLKELKKMCKSNSTMMKVASMLPPGVMFADYERCSQVDSQYSCSSSTSQSPGSPPKYEYELKFTARSDSAAGQRTTSSALRPSVYSTGRLLVGLAALAVALFVSNSGL